MPEIIVKQPELREVCIWPCREVRIDPASEDKKKRIVGHAAVFNQLSENMGFRNYEFYEKIAPGAFDDVMSDDVRSLFNHDYNKVLGRTANKSLILSLDEIGLYTETYPPDTDTAREVLTLIEGGYVNQMSFAFNLKEDKWEYYEKDGKEVTIRTILKFSRLWDISPVTVPAYPQTDVGLRSIDQIFEEGRKRAQKINNSKSEKEDNDGKETPSGTPLEILLRRRMP